MMTRIPLATLALLVAIATTPFAAQAGFPGKGGGNSGGGGGGKGGGNFSRSSITKHLNSNKHHNHDHHDHHHHGHHHHHKYYHRPVYVQPSPVVVHRPVDHCHHPLHCHAFVMPGDSLPVIAQREYGNAAFWAKVAEFNGLPPGAPLAPGQMVKLPAIYDSGRMIPSSAPAPPQPVGIPQGAIGPGQGGPALGGPAQANFPGQGPVPQGFAPQGPPPQGVAPQGGPQQPLPPGNEPLPQPSSVPTETVSVLRQASLNQANIRQAPPRHAPTFATGSELMLDGKQFGEATGSVRLVIGPLAVPVAIGNWSASEVSVKLPMLELAGPADADLVVIDAQGKLITKTKIRLVASQGRLAMEN